MRLLIVIGALLALGLSIQATAADAYACRQANGVIAYQDMPCAKGEKQLRHVQYTPHVYAPPSSVPYGGAPEPADDEYTQPTRTYTYQPPYPQNSRQPAATCQGIGCTAQQRGAVHTQQCVAPNGRIYYTAGPCATRVTVVGNQPRNWRNDRVQGVPDAIMTSPDTALDPRTGRTIQLWHEPEVAPVYQRTQDRGTPVAPADACKLARLDAHMSPHDAARAHTVCNTGRGLWDQAPPDRGIH